MALTLVKEDGTGKVDANSYAAVADGDAYFEGHLYASAWTAATSGTKAAALVMATRLVDSQFQFNGYRAHETQALQWPRERCPDPDRNLVTQLVAVAGADQFRAERRGAGRGGVCGVRDGAGAVDRGPDGGAAG